jgi:NAD(P)-dependent dehydrogenase (short-subunit alcohol dehydrogenase family)
MRELAGKAAFVIGGASGIGLALGKAFAEACLGRVLARTDKPSWSFAAGASTWNCAWATLGGAKV